MLSRTLIEPDRIKALERYRLMDSFPDPAFERLTNMAAQLFDAPAAIISLVGSDRVWFKSHWGTRTREVCRAGSFCSHAILGADVLVVPDARNDARFAGNSMVVDHGYRFYAGAPLRSLDRYHLGALCVLDTRPRKGWTEFQSRILADLAAITVDEMELRRRIRGRQAAKLDVQLQRFGRPEGLPIARAATRSGSLKHDDPMQMEVGRAIERFMFDRELESIA
jgi:GAF domain-containing protein